MENVYINIAWIILIYFIPTIAVLTNSNKKNKAQVVLLNILAGWTVIGWFVLLFIAMWRD